MWKGKIFKTPTEINCCTSLPQQFKPFALILECVNNVFRRLATLHCKLNVAAKICPVIFKCISDVNLHWLTSIIYTLCSLSSRNYIFVRFWLFSQHPVPSTVAISWPLLMQCARLKKINTTNHLFKHIYRTVNIRTYQVNRSSIADEWSGVYCDNGMQSSKYQYLIKPLVSTNIMFTIEDITPGDAKYYVEGVSVRGAWVRGGAVLLV